MGAAMAQPMTMEAGKLFLMGFPMGVPMDVPMVVPMGVPMGVPIVLKHPNWELSAIIPI